PTAAFTADVTEGDAPLNVQFTDMSTGDTPLSYAWDFDNDGTVDSTEQDPSFTYDASGIYNVTLTVGNSFGTDTVTKEGYITVSEPASMSPVLYLPFNEESGSTAIDSSGYGNDGIIYGAIRTNGITGGALNFSDSEDYIQFSTPVDNTAPFTVETWVKPAGSSPTTNQYVIANGGETSPSYGFALFYHSESGWTFCIKDGQGWNEANQNSTAPLPREWTHLVGVWDGSQNPDSIKLYVNGECAGLATPVHYPTEVTERNLRIGAPTSTLNYGFLGLIDEVTIYQGVLSAEEIRSNYFKYAASPDEPVLVLHFDEGEGTVASDSSGHDQTTMMTGTTWTDGFSGSALLFDGTLDSTTTFLSEQVTGDLTLSLWMRNSNLTSYQQRIADLAPPEDIGMQICLFTDGRLLIDNSGGPSSQVWSGQQYNDGVWHYVTGVRRGNSYELYVDGEFLNASTGSIPSYAQLVLANRAAVSNEEFNGTIDEVVLYKRALSPAEIADQYLASYTSPPAAAFTASPVAGMAPLTVQFTDNSENPAAWLWDFGDGTHDTSDAPSHEYTESGWYSPALTVTNSRGSDTLVQQDSIRVYTAYYTVTFGLDGVTITGTGPGQHFFFDTTSGSQYAIENDTITVYGPPGGIAGITYHLSTLSIGGDGIVSGTIVSADVRATQALPPIEIPGLGMIALPSINLSLSSIPDNAGLEVGIISGAGAGLQAGFDQAAGAEGLSADSVAYCMDILPVNLTGVITNASVTMQAPESFVDAYGAGNIRICRDHGGTYSVLDTKIIGEYPSTVFFEGFSPGGFSTFGLVGMTSPSGKEELHDGRDEEYTPEPSGDDETPDEGVEPGDEEEVVEKIADETAENPPSLAPPLEPVLPELPDSGDDSLFDVILRTIDTETETARTILSQNSDVMSLCSMVQEGGARVSGIDGGDSGKQVPAGSVLPAPILPIAAVTTSIALSGAMVAAGFVAQRAGTSVATSFLGNLLGELRRIADFVTSFIGEHFLEFIGEKEAGFTALFASGGAGATRRFFSGPEMAVLGIGAILYGLAFIVADRASYIPVLIVSYVVVTGVAIAGHEIAHHIISRRYEVDSRVRIYYTGMVVSFLTAWLFGNVFAQPLMTHITDTEKLGKREKGIIMLAGPAVSIVLAVLFLLLVPLGGLWVLAGTVGFSANLLEAVYSLVPCTPMDGKHVCTWNKYVWLLLFVPAIIIYLLLYVI
ncbi:MAG: PKD domain-containing protein, partial [Methanomicrobiaceae archaeon]|nr:PKD domain-containing protein [Methanomicrobiaceae archaeon]